LPEPALPSPFQPFAALLGGEAGELLQLDKPLWLTQAPGRLHALGGPGEGPGIATLSVPIARSVYCAIQVREDQRIRIRSLLPKKWGGIRLWEGLVSSLYTKKGPPRSLAVLRDTFAQTDDEWMMRLVASMLGLRRTRQLNTPKTGFDMVIWSRVPEGIGYGERAAFGVATALAFRASTGLAKKRLDGVQIARAVVQGAREILGEDIPMVDALTSALGHRDCALFVEHGIDRNMQWIPIPPQCSISVLDLGFREFPSEEVRRKPRIAAEMALAYLNQAMRKEGKAGYGSWGQITPGEFEGGLRSLVPASQSGAEWLKLFSRRKDLVELAREVDPAATYRLRASAEHQCRESGRARRMVANLNDYTRTLRETFLAEAGRCLSSSHRSFREKCKIELPIADEFLAEFNAGGRRSGMFGARLTQEGGSSVLAALVHQSSRQPVRELVEAFCAKHPECGPGQVIHGSQEGGVLRGWWEGVLEPTPEATPGAKASSTAESSVPLK